MLNYLGPFELTKLSAQVSVLMADRNTPGSSELAKTREVARSYQNKGTLKTAKNIIKHRGIAGLYSGFQLHLRKTHGLISSRMAFNTCE